jgi:GxxExxY protein
MEVKDYSNEVIGCAIEVHKRLGPGLLESIYSECLRIELLHKGIAFEYEKEIPIVYRDVVLNAKYRLDFVVENSLILELKSIDKVLPVHVAQVMTYMKLCNLKLGLLLNFNVAYLKEGIKRFIL